MDTITVIGGGFAGVEAAWAAANRGIKCILYEMRPVKMTPAHKTGKLAELVCSNSFKSKLPTSPAGQLKAEMVGLGSLVIPTGEKHSVPGGEALAVDREKFSEEITKTLEAHPLIEIKREEFSPEILEQSRKLGPVIIATGPLTSEPLAKWLAVTTGQDHLYFYDAVSPTVDASTINRDIVFAQSRYDKGDGDDYLNCPFDKEQYTAFVKALVEAEQVPLHEFEKPQYFQGCMPIEEIAKKGERSLAFGNFKPVGLTDPKTEKRAYAVVQLRPENREKTLYSLVACQNRLKWGVQKQVLQMIPGLEKAEFVRLGVIHRNTYINAPQALKPNLELKNCPGVFIAGQLTGVEGYVESAAMGIYAGIHAVLSLQEKEPIIPERPSAYGSLLMHLQDSTPRHFAPMNINWGLFPDPQPAVRDKAERQDAKLKGAQEAFYNWQKLILATVPTNTLGCIKSHIAIAKASATSSGLGGF